MLLARKDGYWYIAVRSRPESLGCALRIGPMMPREAGFTPMPPVGAWMSKQLESTDGVTFFPTIKYQGLRVEPISWHPESRELRVKCRLDTSEVTSSVLHFDDLAGTDRAYNKRVAELKAEGWAWDAREGGQKYLHVDELEKIEGPPPDGVF